MSDLQILNELEAERAEVESLLISLAEEIRTAQQNWQRKHSLRVRLSQHLSRLDAQIQAMKDARRALAA